MANIPALFNQAANKAGFAAVYPVPQSPDYKTLLPGAYGTFNDGIFVVLGTIYGSKFRAPAQPAPIGSSFNGSCTWQSESCSVTKGSINADGAFEDADFGAGGVTSAIQFTSSDDVLFSATSGGILTLYTLSEPSVFGPGSPIIPNVEAYPDYHDLRFVSELYTATSYHAWGGESRNASTVFSGTQEALTAELQGTVGADLSVVSSNVRTISEYEYESSEPIPVAMQLMAFSQRHKKWVADNSQP